MSIPSLLISLRSSYAIFCMNVMISVNSLSSLCIFWEAFHSGQGRIWHSGARDWGPSWLFWWIAGEDSFLLQRFCLPSASLLLAACPLWRPRFLCRLAHNKPFFLLSSSNILLWLFRVLGLGFSFLWFHQVQYVLHTSFFFLLYFRFASLSTKVCSYFVHFLQYFIHTTLSLDHTLS